MPTDRLVTLTLISAATGKTLDTGDVPADALPTSFSARTTLHLGGRTLVVERADPVDRRDYERTGALRLWVRDARPGEFVHLTLVDAETGSVLESSHVGLDELPEALVEGAYSQVAGVDHSVVRADPPTRAGWASTGQLTVHLARRERHRIRPDQKLWFAVPTIADDIAPIDGGPITGTEFVLDEDEWRQIELVGADRAAEIDAELEMIRAIREHARGDRGGYATSHPRARVAAPLGEYRIECDAIAELLRRHEVAAAPGIEAMGLRIDGCATRVRDGFAFHMSGAWVLYGFHVDGYVRTLGFDCRTVAPAVSAFASTMDWLRARAVDELSSRSGLAENFVAAVRALAEQHDLVLVDWCRGVRLSPRDAGLADVFGSACA